MDNWNIPAGIDRLELNAALTRLTDGWSLADAQLVIMAFSTMPPIEHRTEHVVMLPGGPQSNVTGHTPQHGNVDINVPDDEGKVFRFGENKNVARIGSFKVSRLLPGSTEMLSFGPFWESDTTKQGEDEPSHWVLEYNGLTGEPLELARHDTVPADLSLPLKIFRFFIESVGGSFELYETVPTIMYKQSREEKS